MIAPAHVSDTNTKQEFSNKKGFLLQSLVEGKNTEKADNAISWSHLKHVVPSVKP